MRVTIAHIAQATKLKRWRQISVSAVTRGPNKGNPTSDSLSGILCSPDHSVFPGGSPSLGASTLSP